MEQKKYFENWGIFILGSIIILTFIVLVIKKIIPTNDSWLTVGFLIGVLVALWYANETYRLRKLSSQQIEADFQPVLNFFVRDWDEKPESNFYIIHDQNKQVLKIRNTGKGVGLNLKVKIKNMDTGKEIIGVDRLEQTIIAPEKDEVHVLLGRKLDRVNELDSAKVTISAESTTKIVYTYEFQIENLDERKIKFLGASNE